MTRVGAIAVAVCLVACGRFSFDARDRDDGGGNGDTLGDGTTDVLPDTAFTRVTYVKASNTDAGDQYGLSVAISADGSTIAVGAPLESSRATTINGNQTDDSGTEAGAVYVFRRVGDSWQQEAYVKPANGELGDQFGWSVALSDDGSTLAVGARREDGGGTLVNPADNNNIMSAGAAYVFVRSGATWSQQAYVKAPNPDVSDALGQTIALSGDGNTLAVSSVEEDSIATGIDGNAGDNSAPAAGAVYVYSRSGTTWTFQAYVKASNTDAGDEFGWKIALTANGSTMAIGAYREDSIATGVGGNDADDSVTNAGAVYVFTRAGTTWSQRAYVKASNTELGDNFGYGVALDAAGARLAVTATSESSGSRGINGEQTNNNALYSGAVYVFDGGGAAWTQTAYIKSSNNEAGDEVGFCITLSPDGSVLVTGATAEASAATGIDGDSTNNSAMSSGAAYLFSNSGGWAEQRYLKALNTGAGDEFGWGCALSNTGTLVVSAPFEDGDATGPAATPNDNAAESGAIYIYD